MAWNDDLEQLADALGRRMARAFGEELLAVLDGRRGDGRASAAETVTKLDFMTVEQAAEFLAIAPKTVRALAKRGELGAHRVGQRLRIRRDDLDRYLERVRQAGGSAEADDIAREILGRVANADK